MRLGTQRNGAARRRVLQRVVQQIRHRLLHLLVVERQCRCFRRIESVQAHILAHECFAPAGFDFGQAVSKIVFPQVHHELAALERRIIQEHRNQAHQALATFFRFLQDVLLFPGQLAERARQQQIVISLDHG